MNGRSRNQVRLVSYPPQSRCKIIAARNRAGTILSFLLSYSLCEMLHDPTDETRRKPRQLRNTPLKKYVRLASLAITLCYAGAMYISWRRNVVPLLNEEQYKTSQLSEDEKTTPADYFPFLKDTIEKVVQKQQPSSTVEAESKDTQANQ